jgi:flavin-dependent dehydrogenase
MSFIWDAVVVGGGPAGSVAAYQLARSGRRVLLLEANQGRPRRIGESLRGIAGALLRSIGLGAILNQGHQTSCGNASSWGDTRLVYTDFIQDPHGLGWHLDRKRFDEDLRCAASLAGARRRRARVQVIDRIDGVGFSLGLADGSRLRTRWVIDATGRNALVARSQGARRTRDDGLLSLHAWVRPKRAEAHRRTLVESAAIGWWYTACISRAVRVVSLHVDAEQARAILRKASAWSEHLAATHHMRDLVGASALPSKPWVVDAAGGRLDRFAGAGWLAVGDAALSFDPISAQGLYNALYTGMRGAEVVHRLLEHPGADLAGYSERLESIRAAYRRHHALAYQMEARWTGAAFWKRRALSRTQGAGAQ